MKTFLEDRISINLVLDYVWKLEQDAVKLRYAISDEKDPMECHYMAGQYDIARQSIIELRKALDIGASDYV